jgi:3-isopropylmalate/(R)-2-methylmalate dehydratase large subunit
MPGRTLAEKLISAHAGKEVQANDIVIVDVDRVLFQDWTGPLGVRQILELGILPPKLARKTYFFFDHSSPSYSKEISANHVLMREFAKKYGASVYDVGTGIIHTLAMELLVNPGELIVGADSHTLLSGAMGAFATGMGSTDVAVACALGKTWLRVPETIRVQVDGKLRKGVDPKDIMLHLIGKITEEGANYKAIEFAGSAVERMNIDNRSTLTEQCAEAGAKAGLVAPDGQTKAYLKEHGRPGAFKAIQADRDARYEDTIRIDASALEPLIAFPHTVDNIKPISHPDVRRVKVDQVFIGTCCNGMIGDMRTVAGIIRGKRVSPDVRCIVTPASTRVFLQAMKEGLIQDMVEAGVLVTNPGCGPCPGGHQGILAPGEACLTTQPRNFKGRMGDPDSSIYLANPAVCAATALTGRITDPRESL